MHTFDYIQEHDDTGWWSPYVWPGADALMSWESVGMVIIGEGPAVTSNDSGWCRSRRRALCDQCELEMVGVR